MLAEKIFALILFGTVVLASTSNKTNSTFTYNPRQNSIRDSNVNIKFYQLQGSRISYCTFDDTSKGALACTEETGISASYSVALDPVNNKLAITARA